MSIKHNLLLIYFNFNISVDCVQYIYDFIRNSCANKIINSWFNHINYKMLLFTNIMNIPFLYSHNLSYKYYSPFDPFVAYNFYKASIVISKYDDIDILAKYFIRLNNYFKYVPIIDYNDKTVKYCYNALINFKTNILYFN